MSRKAKTHRRFLFGLVALFAVFVAAVAVLLLSPVFNIREVDVLGNSLVTKASINSKLALGEETNIFSLTLKEVRALLSTDPYIKNVVVEKHFPDKITLRITERKPCSFVEDKSMGVFLVVDAEGMVLDARTFTDDSLPLLTNLDFSAFKVGTVLEISEPDLFSTVTALSQTLEAYEIQNLVKISMPTTKDIHLFIRNIDCAIGGLDDIDEKIRLLKAIIETMSLDDKGTLDLRDISTPHVFTPYR